MGMVVLRSKSPEPAAWFRTAASLTRSLEERFLFRTRIRQMATSVHTAPFRIRFPFARRQYFRTVAAKPPNLAI